MTTQPVAGMDRHALDRSVLVAQLPTAPAHTLLADADPRCAWHYQGTPSKSSAGSAMSRMLPASGMPRRVDNESSSSVVNGLARG